MQEITSIQNNIIKEVFALHQKKKRDELGLFLIEGYKGVSEALNSGINLEKVFIGPDFDKSLDDFSEEKLYKVTDQVMNKMATTESPPEIIATAHKINYSIRDLLKIENLVILVLENIKDPGNLGTIIRTAAACCISGIILTDNTVDIYNPKVVRSSAANLWKIPIIYMPDKTRIKENLNNIKASQFIGTTVSSVKSQDIYSEIDYKKPTVLMFGSEAEGLSEELASQADKLITIPMSPQVESLNLSISVGVVLYETFAQRQFKC